MRLFKLSILALVLVVATPLAAQTPDKTFMAEAGGQMAMMMRDMQVRPSGDVDADFVSMMEPHHQAAIEMAQSELRYGRNEQLRRISQEIIIDQQQEIAAMRLAVGRSLPALAAAPTQSSPPHPSRDH